MITWEADPRVPSIQYGQCNRGLFTLTKHPHGVFFLFWNGRLIETMRCTSASDGPGKAMAAAYLRSDRLPI